MFPLSRPMTIGCLLVIAVGTSELPAEARVGTPDLVGQWSEAFAQPGPGRLPVPEAMAVLPDGRVLYLDGDDSAGPGSPDQRMGILDLRSGSPVFERPPDTADPPPARSADLVTLADGRVLIGAAEEGQEGLRASGTTIFEPGAARFDRTGRMAHSHHHASLVTLANGRVVVAGGVASPTGSLPAETFDPDSGLWSHDPTATTPLPLEPRLHLMPNGKVFYGGGGRDTPGPNSFPEEALAQERFFDPATGSWTPAGRSPYGPRDGAFSVLLAMEPPCDQATVLTAGGGAGRGGVGSPALGLASLTTVDRKGQTAHSRTGDLQSPRRFGSAVGLPDGTVFVVGGSNGTPGLDNDRPASHVHLGLPAPGAAVPSAELYDPASGNWTDMSTPSEGRAARHTAVLLPDGRVLYGGPSALRPGGASFEVFSPPYLFRGRRPRLRDAPAAVAWGGSFELATPDAGTIEEVVLSRLPSPRHGADTDARSLRLAFTRTGSNTLTVTAPPDGVSAPPGHYYLFILRTSLAGPIPSIARIVHVQKGGA